MVPASGTGMFGLGPVNDQRHPSEAGSVAGEVPKYEIGAVD